MTLLKVWKNASGVPERADQSTEQKPWSTIFKLINYYF